MLYKYPNREQALANSSWLFNQDVQIITYHTTTPSPTHPQILECNHHALILPKHSNSHNYTTNNVLFRTSSPAFSTDAALITLLNELEQLIDETIHKPPTTSSPRVKAATTSQQHPNPQVQTAPPPPMSCHHNHQLPSRTCPPCYERWEHEVHCAILAEEEIQRQRDEALAAEALAAEAEHARAEAYVQSQDDDTEAPDSVARTECGLCWEMGKYPYYPDYADVEYRIEDLCSWCDEQEEGEVQYAIAIERRRDEALVEQYALSEMEVVRRIDTPGGMLHTMQMDELYGLRVGSAGVLETLRGAAENRVSSTPDLVDTQAVRVSSPATTITQNRPLSPWRSEVFSQLAMARSQRETPTQDQYTESGTTITLTPGGASTLTEPHEDDVRAHARFSRSIAQHRLPSQADVIYRDRSYLEAVEIWRRGVSG